MELAKKNVMLLLLLLLLLLAAPSSSLQVASIQATSSGTDAVPVLSLVNGGAIEKKCLTYINSNAGC